MEQFFRVLETVQAMVVCFWLEVGIERVFYFNKFIKFGFVMISLSVVSPANLVDAIMHFVFGRLDVQHRHRYRIHVLEDLSLGFGLREAIQDEIFVA